MSAAAPPNDAVALEPQPAAKPPMQKKKSRRNSGALMELRPAEWSENPSPLRALHELLYPSNSKWYWYRNGKIGHSRLTAKYVKFLLYCFALGLMGSGLMMPLLLVLAQAWLKGVHEWQQSGYAPRNVTMLFQGLDPAKIAVMERREFPVWVSLCSKPWFVALQCALSGLATMALYMWSANAMIQEFYVNRKDDAHAWKVQPDDYLTPERWAEEKRLGCSNAFVAGCFGTGLFMLHLNSPTPIFQLYYESGSRGLAYFFLSSALVYFWVDLYSYWTHRALHTPWMYRNVHKVHHRFVHPTPYSAFALHPLEFIMFQSAGVICVSFFPCHVMSFLSVVSARLPLPPPAVARRADRERWWRLAGRICEHAQPAGPQRRGL
jgi:sterol desaturase/sphingolipid hydroxylase (fatty acid hydroxylase superfamily)